VAEKFARYWRPGEPSLDRVTIKIFDNVDAMIAALESGGIDMVNVFPPTQAERIKARFNVLEGYEGALGDVIRVNPLRPPLSTM
jgi:ABC-type transport system substrate-binding protein